MLSTGVASHRRAISLTGKKTIWEKATDVRRELVLQVRPSDDGPLPGKSDSEAIGWSRLCSRSRSGSRLLWGGGMDGWMDGIRMEEALAFGLWSGLSWSYGMVQTLTHIMLIILLVASASASPGSDHVTHDEIETREGSRTTVMPALRLLMSRRCRG